MCGENCNCRKYKVYKVDGECCYSGYSLVAAKNPEEAIKYIKSFKENDSLNEGNSFGYCEYITEEDQIEGIWSEEPGIIHYGIIYCG